MVYYYIQFKFIIYNVATTNIRVSEPDVLSEGLRLFATTRLDFVDALLVGYHRIRQAKVFSFDKKVNALVRQ